MKTAIRLGLVAAAAMSFAGAAGAASMATMDYVKKAGAGDLYEKTSSKLVLQSTKDPKVRQFANQMITDHTKSTGMIKSAALESGVHPKPPMLDPDQKDMVAKLRAAKGSARDQLYWDQQKTAHQQALDVHTQYSQNGDAPALKSAAGQIVPVVQSHISMLNGGGM